MNKEDFTKFTLEFEEKHQHFFSYDVGNTFYEVSLLFKVPQSYCRKAVVSCASLEDVESILNEAKETGYYLGHRTYEKKLLEHIHN